MDHFGPNGLTPVHVSSGQKGKKMRLPYKPRPYTYKFKLRKVHGVMIKLLLQSHPS